MQLVIQVKQWILSPRPDYNIGLELLSQALPIRQPFMNALSQPSASASSYNRDKLFLELKKYYLQNKHLLDGLKDIEVAEPPKQPVEEKQIPSEIVKEIPSGGTKKDRYPEELHQYIDEQSELYKKRDFTFYRVQAGAVKGKKNLSLSAKFLLESERRIKEIWIALDYYDRHKSILPAFSSEKNAQLFLTAKSRMLTVRTYISRYTKLLDKTEGVEKAKALDRLTKYREELKILETQLGEK